MNLGRLGFGCDLTTKKLAEMPETVTTQMCAGWLWLAQRCGVQMHLPEVSSTNF